MENGPKQILTLGVHVLEGYLYICLSRVYFAHTMKYLYFNLYHKALVVLAGAAAAILSWVARNWHFPTLQVLLASLTREVAHVVCKLMRCTCIYTSSSGSACPTLLEGHCPSIKIIGEAVAPLGPPLPLPLLCTDALGYDGHNSSFSSPPPPPYSDLTPITQKGSHIST